MASGGEQFGGLRTCHRNCVIPRNFHGDIQRCYRLRKRELLEWGARKLIQIVGGAGHGPTLGT